ncbi:SAM-dependent methyltransferase [Polynucleobacter sp. MWH-Spelu-300-X4]|uniref:class I SAM-dependent methyltransferase n=1 Tax=Polynucleobacter sp. MWH-Spelu-300-X4 TaxID=2689109 RepID=UPI001BFD6478|nr:SAM-dependent methyltransferase [Polynucleobacter sp. MWH-Spelu-300-X4]QWD79356.1 SAM-dependent methyltransferase [Polynucleobacter sp. MWH-Spelu-300-X4]
MNTKSIKKNDSSSKPDAQKHEIRPTQSIELLKELHILTRDGKLNQDSRRKLKQVYHLVQFIEPLLKEVLARKHSLTLVDHGAGKSYLGFILNDLFCKLQPEPSKIIGIEVREELVKKSKDLAEQLNFNSMEFLHLTVEESLNSPLLPQEVNVVTALHACNTATDDAIRFALHKKAQHIVLVPCCQAEIAAALREGKNKTLKNEIAEIWRHPLHTREFGSHITNVLRCLQLESHGYSVTVTELVGWEHSMKNELIIATQKNLPGHKAQERKTKILAEIGLSSFEERFA